MEKSEGKSAKSNGHLKVILGDLSEDMDSQFFDLKELC